MNWLKLATSYDLENLIRNSFSDEVYAIAIFKHSTRCAISTMAKSRLIFSWDFDEKLPIYYLDLIQYRNLSNQIADEFLVEHQSPQLLLIKNGKCIHHASHIGISINDIKQLLELKS
ncbi:MAG: bacillithiol system redox-active protein YtxJ [Flavobacteriales bacterium]|nr:bacillithiol system redox-active protein YtxJ [Flavobacteriales bacterium]PIZ06007.1 MAG: bacillithiol system redox-active protein YtxJ [Flavobacteriales bacterium CG_4_10_14_0_8_um_filter_32_5]